MRGLAAPLTPAALDHPEESARMKTAIGLENVTIYPAVEQQGPFFNAMEFFPTLTKELLEENRWWLQPTFADPVSGRLVLCVQRRHKNAAPQYPGRFLCWQSQAAAGAAVLEYDEQ
jgi:hypothetical protein